MSRFIPFVGSSEAVVKGLPVSTQIGQNVDKSRHDLTQRNDIHSNNSGLLAEKSFRVERMQKREILRLLVLVDPTIVDYKWNM